MKLGLDLENCYGINKLVQELDFTRIDGVDGVCSLYAPNGTLKTSLAKTLKDIEDDRKSKDVIFPERATKRVVTLDGQPVDAGQIMVINSYDESYSSKQVSTLLVNEALKRDYDEALKEVDDKRALLIKELAKSSGKQNKAIPELICEAFDRPEKEFLDLLAELKLQAAQDYSSFAEFKYGDLFNPKVLDLAATESFEQELTGYVETYEKLISESAVLSRSFNHQKAGTVSKSLSDTGFFDASHSVNLSINGQKQEVTSKDRLNEILQEEQNKVFQNPELKEKFSKVDKKLTTKETHAFRDFISEHQELLPEYKDVKGFKKKLITGYLQSHQSVWDDLVSTYKSNQEKVKYIIDQAKQQETIWKGVVDIFNKRFSVPFKLRVDNQDDVILNNAAPSIEFDFDDGRGGQQQVKHETLLDTLSQGEKRALYILNVLFEIEAKKNAGAPILIVIDDIADSFDYKNKYAIVEYLRDIAQVTHFYLLILTHNFDFHRIVGGRIIGSRNRVARNRRMLATKTSTEIKLNPEKYQNDVFVAWKRDMHQNEHYMLASIPFVRNLAEYCGYDAHYLTLTSLLHLKANSQNITVQELQDIYRAVLVDKPALILPDTTSRVIDKIFQKADVLSSAAHESPELESKVIVAMAIRLKAEQFMIAQINDQAFVDSIESNQTRELFDKYVEMLPGHTGIIRLLDQVNLMTPENIHLNSFMYEPILDMSAHRLYTLYNEVKQLGN
ncbi:hypothetical protein M5X66_18440 (plasmid) [Providencia sp. PROV188]|uniref:hypothetical protein n=1 Tax=Providencia TaxID=586 RepID=UPI0003E2A5D0|nr:MULTISPECIES: hypothetical protein [Providencia]UNJ79628.1 hypothetical protein [Providencia sp.]ETS99238.1 hypothetical protein HMPREF1568_3648 [Providencia alcalifaciens PAL-3]EUC99158.1 hypothetical protein HMPREF1566_3863 [Providencia alcalifaciens PAL-1]MTC48205.1 hypothetical protein [Providencia alcalifaciens]WBM62620.1 hypothetical protein M5X66_18440 [Providencia sp. PROV188]